MAWRDTLQPASFRGVSFKVESHDSQFGRRTVTHEYPQRDKPYVEDLGRAARKIKVDGYVVGSNYTVARDALIEACEQGGPGTLVHPYLGTMTVVCEGLTVRERKDEGGMAAITMSFVEAGEAEFPSTIKDSASVLGAAADTVIGQAIIDFAENFTVDNLPQFVTDSASEYVESLADTLEGIASDLLPVDNWTEFYRDSRALVADVLDLVAAPTTLAQQVADLIGYITSYAPTNKSAVYSLMDLFTFGDDRPAVPETTATRRQQAANERAFNALVKEAACAESARLAVLTDFTTWDDATTVQTRIADQIDTQMEVASDQQYISLIGLRSELVQGVPASGDLPRLTTVRTRSVVPSLVLAHRLYGDASRADEIVEQNRIRHPGFISPAASLQVLSDE